MGGWKLVAMMLAVALGGCAGTNGSAPALDPAARCRVTVPGEAFPAGGGSNYGNRSLGVGLWPKGVLVAGRLRDGASFADIAAHGAVEAKLGWWRFTSGRLRVDGERLDGAGPPLRVEVPAGYGARGFQPTMLRFPSPGCWAVVGSVGAARLRFVVRVRLPGGRSSAVPSGEWRRGTLTP